MRGLRQKDQVSSWLQSKNSLLGQKRNEQKISCQNMFNIITFCRFQCTPVHLFFKYNNSYCALIMYLSPQQSQTFYVCTRRIIITMTCYYLYMLNKR